MIIYKQGDIFLENVEAIVNPVNCVGVMGKGLALQFKQKYPDNFKNYREACLQKVVKLGQIHTYINPQTTSNPRYIFNFPTKYHWKNKSQSDDIRIGLIQLAYLIRIFQIKSIAIPPLGCGLGGLKWEDVKSLIEQHLESSSAKIIVLEP
jgi:O-acetyl-ADP-ribose deacetylase (regulator of RNase III)